MIRTPFVRNPYNYDMNEASDESGLECKDPSLAQQQFAEESDINFIADRYGLTGEMPQVLQLPAYQDFEGIFDFQSAQNAVIEAQRQFLTLPAKTRTRFDNDPQKLLAFLDDPENRAEAEFLGLIKPAQKAPDVPSGTPTGDAVTTGAGAPLTPSPTTSTSPTKTDT